MFLNADYIRLLYLLCCRFPNRFIVALSKENGVKLGFRFERPQGNFSEDWQLRQVGTMALAAITQWLTIVVTL